MSNPSDFLESVLDGTSVSSPSAGAPNLLEQAFKKALSKAAAYDRYGLAPQGFEELFPDRTPTHVELIQECLDRYYQDQAHMEAAFRGALDFLGSEHGAAQVSALKASAEGSENNPMSVRIASEIAASPQFDTLAEQGNDNRIVGFGIGVSAGASLFAGAFAGIGGVFDFEDRSVSEFRDWYAFAIKAGLSLSFGLEVSIWYDTPFTGRFFGWLVDLYVPSEGVFVRYMHMKQRAEEGADVEFVGWSLQLPFGFGFPFRRNHRQKHAAGLAAPFIGHQHAWARTPIASLVVTNPDGGETIAVNETTTLTATLTNTSPSDIALNADTTITINMPSYFTSDDVAAMTASLDGWSFTNTGTYLILTLTDAMTWKGSLDITIDNVSSSNEPSRGETYPGLVTVELSTAAIKGVLVKTCEFDLVWADSEATITWSINLDSTEFTLCEGSSLTGVTIGDAAPGDAITEVACVQSVSDPSTQYTLGYQYNYNNEGTPQIRAAWWNPNKKVSTAYTGYETTVSNNDSIAYYEGDDSNPNWIKITPQFGSGEE